MTGNQKEAAFLLEDVCKVYVYKADITKLRVSAIVNAANKKLKHGSGVARAIANAGGKKFNDDCTRIIKEEGYLKTAWVVKTVGGDLPCPWVFHTVGPKWPFKGDKEAMEKCILNLKIAFEYALKHAEDNKLRSIALPPISAGKHGMPANDVALAMVDAIKTFAYANRIISLRDIHLVDIKDDVLPLVIALMNQSAHHNAATVSVKRIRDPVERLASDYSYYAAFMVQDLIKVHIYRKDITKVSVDAIVTAVSKELDIEGSLATAIAQAAGPEVAFRDAIKKLYNDKVKLKFGQVVETIAGRLPCKSVYHIVGPPKYLSDYGRQNLDECQDYLTRAFKNSMAYTTDGICESIAVPPISSGKFGVPELIVAKAMVDAIKSFALIDKNRVKHTEIHVVDVKDDILGLVISLLDLGTYMDVKTGKRVSVKTTTFKRADNDDEPPQKKKR